LRVRGKKMENKLKILFVEDDAITRHLIVLQLGRYYENIYEAENGQVGLNMYNEIKPDIIITDMSMPIMNGFAMIEAIRRVDTDVKIIVASAFNIDENVQADYVLSKPVFIDNILKAIDKLCA